MLPRQAFDACSDSRLLTDFLEIVGAAFDPDHGLPCKDRLDVVRLGRRQVLPFLWIMELGGDGQFRFRLVGEEIVRNFGATPRGKTLEEAIGAGAVAPLHEALGAALSERAVLFISGPVTRSGVRHYTARRILVPMCDRSGAERYVICCFERLDEHPTATVETGIRFAVDEVRKFPLA